MNKYYAIIPKEKESTVLSLLCKTLKLPHIKKRLNFYSKNENNDLQIEFKNNRIYLKINSGHPKDKYIEIRNKNIKFFLRYLKTLGFNQGNLNQINIFEFSDKNFEINLLIDTFIGTLLDVSYKTTHGKGRSLEVLDKIKELKIDILQKADLEKVIANINIPKEDIFHKYDVLNEKIKSYSYTSGIDIRADSETLKARLEALSNDYSFLEKDFKQIANVELLSEENIQDYSYFKPVSIIIPSYNSNKKLIYTLLSIQSQNLSQSQKKLLQVIVVDDGSNEPVTTTINESGFYFDFDLNVIRIEKNSDLSTARNIGIAAAKNHHLLFIDSDILLTKNYIIDFVVRSQIIPNALFTSLRKNITIDSEILDIENVKKGLNTPTIVDDSRLKTITSSNFTNYENNIESGRYIEILDDTNYFKKLGFGGSVAAHDLPRMLPGHNIFTTKDVVNEVGGFCTKFKGWGIEDTYFAAKAVANGNYIIPVLSSSVFHIGYGPRDGDMARKIKEFKHNIKIYNELLMEDWQK